MNRTPTRVLVEAAPARVPTQAFYRTPGRAVAASMRNAMAWPRFDPPLAQVM
jgi:hypothetical protein